MRISPNVAVATSLVCGLSVACSLTTSFDGLTGGGLNDGGSSDGRLSDGAELDGPRTTDGGGEAGDGSGTGSDGGEGGADGAVVSCPATAIFCDDFDNRTTLQGAWPQLVGPDPGATAAIGPDHAVSAPNAFTIRSVPTTTAEDAFVVTTIPFGSVRGSILRVDFDMLVETIPSDFGANVDADYAEIIELAFNNKVIVHLGVKHTLGMFVGYNDFSTSTPTYTAVPIGAPPSSSVHVNFTITFGKPAGRIDYTVGNSPGTARVATEPGPSPGPITVYFGLGLNGTSPHTNVYLDNFVAQ